MLEAMSIGSRYILHEPLGTGSMGAVFRATDRLTQTTVALKRVTASLKEIELAGEFSTASSYGTGLSLALAHEFQTLAGLHHPYIIRVLDYGFDQDGPYFAMEYLAGAQTVVEAGLALPAAERVRLLVQALQALSYLHRHRILHRDLKPANILVRDGQVKLLDFGLSVRREQAEGVAGTLAYMAPEVIRGLPVSEATDLYSLGVIAYEMFAGYHPFARGNEPLINRILTTVPDASALRFDDRPGDAPATTSSLQMGLIIQRLLQSDPAARYRTAQDVIRELSTASHQPDLAEEPLAIRESYLQAAPFVARSVEFNRLNAALDRAIQGQGSAWLLGGESGVGKSRLMDELRSPALVKGALVLPGQALDGTGQPYYLWRAPLRRLVLAVPMDDADAAVCKEIIPDLETLIGRGVPDAPRLDSRSAQQRLAQTFVRLFRSLHQPAVLLLDDLQWARESILPLRELVRVADDLPLLIVTTFRDDERPDIPGEFPLAQVIALKRFDTGGIRALGAAMLGEAGSQPRVVEFLERESEGNVFFMVETVRALAEEAPNLSAIAQMPLPERLFPKGVQAIAQRRLERLPLDYHPLLRIAAVAGRQIDLNLLRQVDPVFNLDLWLLMCTEAGILTAYEDQWMFVHNKLRDGILHGLAEDQPRKLNRLVAEAIEAMYPEDASYALALLQHWRAAEESAKEVHYARVAAAQMMSVSSYGEARALLEDVLRRAEAAKDSLPPEERPGVEQDLVALWVQLGEALYFLSEYDQSQQVLEEALIAASQQDDLTDAAMAYGLLGSIALAMGRYDEAREVTGRGLAISEAAGDHLRMARALRTLGLAAENQGNVTEATQFYREGLALFRAVDDAPGTAATLANLGSAAIQRGDAEEARSLFEEALELFKTIGYRWGVAYTQIRVGEVLFVSGDYAEAQAALEEALAISHEIGQRWGTAFALVQLGRVAHALRQTRQAGEYFYKALSTASDIQVVPTILEALTGIALFLQSDEQPDRAAELLGLVLAHPAADSDTQRRATEQLARLQEVLGPDGLTAAQDRGRGMDLDSLVTALLDEGGRAGG